MTASTQPIRGFAWLLAALVALGPLAIDAYLPAMPEMAKDLGTSLHNIEITLSVFLVGFAAGQLIGGPFSDRFGRRLTILVGLSLFILGSVFIALGSRIELLWVGRVLQAFGGGMGVVNTMAVVRDRYAGSESAKILSQIVTIMMAAPLLAPFIGALLLLVSDWRSIFWFLALYAVLLLILLRRYLPETRKIQQHAQKQSVWQRYRSVIQNKRAAGFLFAVAFSNAGMFAFLTSSPGVYMGYYQISPTLYPVLFALNIVTLSICNQVNIRLLRHHSPANILRRGQSLQLIVGAIMLVLVLLFSLPIWLLVPQIMIFVGLQGFVVANGMSAVTDEFPYNSATATALISASGFTLGAFTGAISAFLSDGSPLAMVAVMACCPLIGITLRRLFHGKVKK
ncbi:MAG: multidrug effflux MFS transporter [Aliidiomarina sp.]|uniref:multidrug effflux MFS transporter n=1 Tax=Aliidiomarina sp. TaxID=1872439 RepID=UPI0025B8C179|nr:multidrug effflux MFS transporter [Aliidiomarina sp.]MCH8502122.1 multidrug effflux MFS transporter [Aliidiomarina sp.]